MPTNQNPDPVSVDLHLPLREQFTQALKVKGRADKTVEHYVRAMEHFCTFSSITPFRATINHIRAYLYHLLQERKLAPRTYNQQMYGIIAFYEIFRPELPIRSICLRHKTDRRIITVLDHAEVDAMLLATTNLKHQALISTLYGSGIRVQECVGLTFEDIDRTNMLLKVCGKGDVDRFTILSGRSLEYLEAHYRHNKPITHMFEGHGNKPLTTHMVEIAVKNAALKAGIKKK